MGVRAAIRKLELELLSFLTLRVQGFGFRVWGLEFGFRV